MSNSKKILSVLLSLILAFGSVAVVPLYVSAAEAEVTPTASTIDEAYPDFSYNVYNDGRVSISKYTGEGGDITIPSTLDGHIVTNIGERAFYGCTVLTNVTIPESVTSIGDFAFRKCTGLTSVTIGDSVTSIGNSAFDGCTGLTSVTIPESVLTIGFSAFDRCPELKSVVIPKTVVSIGVFAFGVKSNADGYGLIKGFKLYGYKGSSAEDYAKKVRITFIPLDETTPSEDHNEYSYALKTDDTIEITGYNGLDGDITIPSSIYGYTVTGIGGSAFRGCTSLTSIDIPDSVTSIGNGTFYGCTWLTSVTIHDSVTSIGSGAFYDTAWYNNQPDGLVYAGKVAYKMKGDCPSEIVIKDGTLGIAGSAFDGCTGLTSVTIPDSVSSIGGSAFYGCTGLTSVTIPDSVSSISSSAFGYYDVSADRFHIKIDDFTIYGYEGSEAERYANDNDFTFVPIRVSSPDEATPDEATPDEATPDEATPDEATTDEATPDEATPDEAVPISGTTGDCTWSLDNGVLTISGNGRMGEYEDEYNDQKGTNMTTAPWGSYSINSVVIQNGVTDIGSYAFDGLTELKSVTIGNSVTSIGVEAFRYCKGLTAIEIPGSVKSIDARAFYDCLGLTSIDIPNSVISIGNYAFSGCMRAKSITIPDSVTSIGEGAFTECAPITSVTIPGSVTSIGSKAFGYVYGSKKTDFIIYGYEGSEAEKYAKDNEFTFVPLKDKADTTTGIILAVPEDTELTVKDITSEIICDLPDGCNKMTAYDISLTKDGEAVQPENIVTVKIPCSNKNAKVYRHESDGKMTDMNAKFKDGYMVFTTDHFSVYVLAEPEPEVVAVPGDVTGDGKTNVQDCTAILRYVRKLDTLTEDQLKRADVTGDGKVNVQDVTRILRHVRKIEELY